jgi:hypothetical protein
MFKARAPVIEPTRLKQAARIGVLTFHRCINYGSYWQARCLAEALSRFGCEVHIMDYCSARRDRAEWKCALNPVSGAPLAQNDRPLYRLKLEKFMEAIAALPLLPPFALDAPASAPPCDTIVVGSDEVWNRDHPWYGRCGAFFGEGLRANRLVSYAATFGCQSGDDHPHIERLRDFDAISVRDQNSRSIILRTLGLDVEEVLDPCLLSPPELPRMAPTGGPSKPYLLVYGHSFSEPFSRNVAEWARRQRLCTVSIGYRNDWTNEQWITAGPLEFAHAIKHAEAIATNFFHGCVFSLNERKRFVCESFPYRYAKIQNLIASLGADGHLVTCRSEDKAYARALDLDDASAMSETISELRRSSLLYLERAVTTPSHARSQ